MNVITSYIFICYIYLFDIGLRVRVGGLCGGWGAVVIISTSFPWLLHTALSLCLSIFFFLLFLSFCFGSYFPFGFQNCTNKQTKTVMLKMLQWFDLLQEMWYFATADDIIKENSQIIFDIACCQKNKPFIYKWSI